MRSFVDHRGETMQNQRSTTPSKWPKRPPLTGVRLPRELVLRAKHRALDDGKTLARLVEEALKEYLSRR